MGGESNSFSIKEFEMDYANVSRKFEMEEFDLDFLPEETGEEDNPKLMLADKIGEPEKNPPLSPAQVDDGENKSGELSFDDKEESLYADPQGGENSPLVIYFKSINSFPLLAEEEEKILAKRIKKSEEEYKKLIELKYIDLRYTKDNQIGVRYEPWHIKVV